MNPEPIFDHAHLGHMELLAPKPDESLCAYANQGQIRDKLKR